MIASTLGSIYIFTITIILSCSPAEIHSIAFQTLASDSCSEDDITTTARVGPNLKEIKLFDVQDASGLCGVLWARSLRCQARCGSYEAH